MKLADSRANPGKATTSRTTATAEPVPTKRRASRYVDAIPIDCHDQPECRERPRIAPGQPQERLHQRELTDEGCRVPGHVGLARPKQV